MKSNANILKWVFKRTLELQRWEEMEINKSNLLSHDGAIWARRGHEASVNSGQGRDLNLGHQLPGESSRAHSGPREMPRSEDGGSTPHVEGLGPRWASLQAGGLEGERLRSLVTLFTALQPCWPLTAP